MKIDGKIELLKHTGLAISSRPPKSKKKTQTNLGSRNLEQETPNITPPPTNPRRRSQNFMDLLKIFNKEDPPAPPLGAYGQAGTIQFLPSTMENVFDWLIMVM